MRHGHGWSAGQRHDRRDPCRISSSPARAGHVLLFVVGVTAELMLLLAAFFAFRASAFRCTKHIVATDEIRRDDQSAHSQELVWDC
jgi:hypothetical protein